MSYRGIFHCYRDFVCHGSTGRVMPTSRPRGHPCRRSLRREHCYVVTRSNLDRALVDECVSSSAEGYKAISCNTSSFRLTCSQVHIKVYAAAFWAPILWKLRPSKHTCLHAPARMGHRGWRIILHIGYLGNPWGDKSKKVLQESMWFKTRSHVVPR